MRYLWTLEYDALVDISKYMIPGNIISIWQSGDLDAFIVNETLVGGLPFHKSVFVEEDNAIPMEHYGDYRYYVVDNTERKEEQRTYLMLCGNSGVIDDIVATEFSTLGDMEASHTKNISLLGFSIEERAMSGTKISLDFDAGGASYMDAMIDPVAKTISSSATIEYGLTKVKEVALSSCRITGAEFERNIIVLKNRDNIVRTPSIYIPSRAAAYEAYVKINSIVADGYRDFRIEVFGASSSSTGFASIEENSNVNLVKIQKNKISSYIYADISGEPGTVIESIEVYVRYAQPSTGALVSSRNPSCSVTTKLYDVGTSANYTVSGMKAEINGDPNAVQLYARGCRWNEKDMVFSDWKHILGDGARFDDYRLFQFRAEIRDPETEVKINSFELVVED